MPQSGADRQRVHADRKRRGLRIARVLVDEVAAAETLIAFGLLARDDADDPAKVDHALSKAVAVWCE
ncbi:hypothetical protein [Bradyrhizobium sp. AUGA SZCCT0182]|uniref:hypothetical protein n=1 Tax=Bradyrhizobium sp. AUGA SZCCT0182 TaxID=2807667 RepID=UPI001BA6F036|nr:hypothetical protein [Bradyrhizobium sp. AUGA SZCCT0182]MBR1231977.1 hypothetical protein [Bradyrhizobium sp. AUGA SZCCT0182]